MPYTIDEEKTFPQSPDAVFNAVKAASAGLEGKILLEDIEGKQVNIQFPKTIHGKVLGDRTVFNTHVLLADGTVNLVVEAFPVDAVGRKLMFGARKGVTRKVLDWFWAHIEHNLEDK